jgi:hypothetical protein
MVRPAKTATVTVGTSAIAAKTPVSRRCSREPAERARRAAIIVAMRPMTRAATTMI